MRRIVHLAAVLALVAVPSASAAAPTTSPLRPNESSSVELAPALFDPETAPPGTTLQLRLRVMNRTSSTVSLRPSVIPLAGSTDPGTFAAPAARTDRSAAAVDWVSFPFERWPRLAPDAQLEFDIAVAVPPDAAPGTYALAIGVQQALSGPAIGGTESRDARVRLDADLVSRLVVTVPGDAVANVRVGDVRVPRVVWLQRRPTFSARATNDGETLLSIDAQVELDAFLGSAGRTLPMRGPEKGYETLPGGVRTLTMHWSDPPLVGWFQPTLVVVGGKDSGVRVSKRLDTVYVLPPWWLVLLAAVAVWLPVRSWRARRRRMRATGADRARALGRVERRLLKQRAQERAREARRQPPKGP